MRGGPLVVVGDTLLDRDVDGRVERLSPDAVAPVVEELGERIRPGGAGLAALLAARDPDAQEVVLVTALSDDRPGRTVRGLLDDAGVTVVDLGLDGATPEKVRVMAAGRCLFRLDRNCSHPATVGPAGDEAVAALASAGAVLVSDYGRGLSADGRLREALARLSARTPVVWDPHPRGAAPVAECRLVTPNRAEASRFASHTGGEGLAAQTARARRLRAEWRAAAVAVTLGPEGALLVEGDGAPLVVPAPPAAAGDPCGAGDRFASTAARLLSDGALVSEAIVGAVAAASAFVAAGGAGRLRLEEGRPRPDAHFTGGSGPDAAALAGAVRARGGTVVATGGCFDVLHAGHVGLLQEARALGDCLIVCLNSDASVRRLKGPGRPRAPVADRTAVLLALECVDAVAVFEEDTPVEVLRGLRPHVFVKGGDYAGADLPEAPVLAGWGGQAVVVPYLEGRSTTQLLAGGPVR
jgi:rfaE bifunctional protein nucleotidyltransferase chain/domain/rfaE bifunctional protein kinase chain/domain